MAEMISLDQLPPEVRVLLDSLGQSSRSPIRTKPLHDLRPKPFNPREPRPSFFFPTDGLMEDGPVYRHQAYPSVRYRLDGETVLERTVTNEAEDSALGASWSAQYPETAPLSNEDLVRRELAMLSDEDRKMVFEAQKQTRLARIQDALNGLSEAQVNDLLNGAAATMKRGPGRPPKAEA